MATSISNEKVNVILEAIARDPNTPWQPTSIVEIPGAYNVYALGTTGDVTLLAWLHSDGKTVTVKHQCW